MGSAIRTTVATAECWRIDGGGWGRLSVWSYKSRKEELVQTSDSVAGEHSCTPHQTSLGFNVTNV